MAVPSLFFLRKSIHLAAVSSFSTTTAFKRAPAVISKAKEYLSSAVIKLATVP